MSIFPFPLSGSAVVSSPSRNLPTGRPKASQWQRGILAAAALVIIQPLRLTLVAGFPVDRGSTPPSEAQNEIMLQSHTVVSIRF